MKNIMRSIIFNIFSLFILSIAFSGVRINGGIISLLISGLILSILMMIIKPILSIVTFPLSIITFGLYSLVSNIVNTMIIFYLLTMLTKQFTIVPFMLEQIRINALVTPRTQLNEVFAFAVVSSVYLIMKGVFSWLTQE